MGRTKYWDGTQWVEVAPSAQEFDEHQANEAIHKTSQQIRGEVTTPLRTEVISSLPASPQKGQLVFNEATGKFSGYDGGKWL